MLAEFRRWPFGVGRRFTVDDRMAYDFSRPPARMFVVYYVVIREHLGITWQVIDAVDNRVNEISAGFENLHPFITWFGSEDIINNSNECFAVFAARAHGR